jgi:hypothetical protein
MVVENSEKEATNSPEKTAKEGTSLPFEIKTLHKKALLKLLHCHHSGIVLTYPELSLEIGVGEKTKAWQCQAWKHLKGGGFIVKGRQQKTFEISQKGVELAMSFASDEELAEFKTPASNDELHEKIRSKLAKDMHKGKKHHGKKIFDLFLKEQDTSFLRLELATTLGTNPDAHSFFYGFKALEKMGLVSTTGKVTKEEFVHKSESLNKLKRANEQGDEKDDGKEKDGEENGETPQQKARIRGGQQLFKLSEKAFLVTAKKRENEE